MICGNLELNGDSPHSHQAKNVKCLIICLQALNGRTTSAQGEALCLG